MRISSFPGLLAIVAGSVILVSLGCDRNEQVATPGKPNAAPAEALPAGLVVSMAPAGAKDIADVFKNAKDGDTVVIRGKVGGREEPFVNSRAIVTVIDLTLPTCDQTPGDNCKTPWDACCEPDDKKLANSATVQVVRADGAVIKAGLEGLGGLKPAKQVVIAGKVKRPGDGKALVVDATAIYVAP